MNDLRTEDHLRVRLTGVGADLERPHSAVLGGRQVAP
jgi:hypothetical protein